MSPESTARSWADRAMEPHELTGVDPLPTGPEGLVCSGKGCTAAATWDLQWNNAKIHTPDRRKHWLACDQHRESLTSFLGSRGFLRDTVALPAD